MEQDQQQSLRQYAWNYVSFYGGQRARLLRLFVAIGSGLALGAAGLLRTEATEIVVVPLGGVLLFLGVLFWIMNRGLGAKVRHGEDALRHLDAELKLPNLKGGGAHVLRLLDQGGGVGEGCGRCCGCDESAIGSLVYLLFALLGFFFAMAPYYPKEMAVGPVAMETPGPRVKATPMATQFAPPRHQPVFPRSTPPGLGQRQFPGFTPPPGFPNRPNGLPARPPFGTPQPGVPTGTPPPGFARPSGTAPAASAPNGVVPPTAAPGLVAPSKQAIAPVGPAPGPAPSGNAAPTPSAGGGGAPK